MTAVIIIYIAVCIFMTFILYLKIFEKYLVLQLFVNSKVFKFFKTHDLKYLNKLADAIHITLVIRRKDNSND